MHLQAVALSVVLTATPSPKPVYGPGPAFDAGTIRDTTCACAFDLPTGLRAERVSNEYWIGPVDGGISMTLSLERLPGHRPELDSGLDAYARFFPSLRCDYDGESESAAVDSLMAFHPFRTTGGLSAIEYLVRVREAFFDRPDDYKGLDTTAVIVSTSTWADSDSTAYKEVVRTAGPEFLIDLRHATRPAVLRLEFDCQRTPNPQMIQLGRAIVSSMRSSQKTSP